MRILLDECLPVPMRDVLGKHDCIAVGDRGWKGIKNGELLRLAEDQFDLFITADQNIRYTENKHRRGDKKEADIILLQGLRNEILWATLFLPHPVPGEFVLMRQSAFS